MTNPIIEHPSRAVPFVALSYGEAGEPAVAVSPSNPLPLLDHGYRNARPLVANTMQIPGQAVLIDCQADGKINLELASGAQLAFSISAGLLILPFVVQRYLSSGTTAQVSVWVID